MRPQPNFIFSIYLCYIILLFFSATTLHAGCSPYIGLATINEINVHNQSSQTSSDTFIESKALSPAILNSGIWRNWTLDVCSAIGAEDGFPCKTGIAVQNYYYDTNGDLVPNDLTGNSWLVTPEFTFNWPYIDLNTSKNNDPRGMSIVLRDENGDLIDYLSVDGYMNPIPACDFIYATDFDGGNDFNLQRLPDGTGVWQGSGGGNSGDQTDNSSNDPAPVEAPVIAINNSEANAGSNMVFTISLTDPQTGASTTTDSTVEINYTTRDATAIAGEEYIAQTGTISIPAGVSSIELSIATLTGGNLNTWFYLDLIEVISGDNNGKNAVIDFNLGKGTIIVPLIDHYEIHHDGHGLTCQPEVITIRACVDALSPCTLLDTVSDVNLATSAGTWIESNPVSFTGTTTVRLRNPDSTLTPLLSLINTDPDASTYCYENGTLDDPCDLAFHDSGFIFDVLDATSGSTQTVSMQAVQRDDTSQACVPYFQNKALSVNFGFSYTNPGSNPHGSQALINGNSFSAMILAETLNFDINGTTSFTVSYPDAGQLTFSATYDNGEMYAVGNSTAIFYPAQFRITANDQSWLATDASSTVLTRAGAGFPVTIEAINTHGNITPNYNDTVNLSVSNAEPISGVTGGLGTSNITLNSGTLTFDQTYSEVGIMTMTANDPDYQGYVINGTSSNIGRFIPDRFRIISGLTVDGILNHADGSFSYLGHEIDGYTTNPSIVVEALSANGTRTTNYQGSYFKLTTADFNITSPTTDKIVVSQPVNILRAGATLISDNNGSATYLFGEDKTTYIRPATATTPIISPQFDFILTQVSDGETTSTPNEVIPVIGGTELRYGRLVLENSFGPETEPISMPVRAEYWDGSQWQPNLLDSSSLYTYAKTENDITTTEHEGSTPVSPASSILSITVSSGAIILTPVTDPSEPGGTIDVTIGAPDWLKFDWDNNLTTPDENPTATATFGIYRGRDRIISWEELPVH